MLHDGLTSTAYVLRGEWEIHLYPWHQDPRISDFSRIPEEYAAFSVEDWFPLDDLSEHFTRWDLGRLYQETSGIHGDLWAWSTPALRRWLEQALREGEVRAYRWREMRPNETHAEYAADLGIDLGVVRALSSYSVARMDTKDNPTPYTAYTSSGSATPMVDDLTEGCPSPSWRSESVDTASPEVIAWFKTYDPTGNTPTDDRWNKTLGSNGGGGFIAGTTRVKTIRKGTRLYRNYDDVGGGSARGCWWFESPLAGDPRVYGALPPKSAGTYLVESVTTDDVEVLHGLGAPRCSNKPGGPIQVCLPYKHVALPLAPRIHLL